MNNEEKILEVLTQLRGDVTQIKGDVTQLRSEVTDLEGRVTQMEGAMSAMNTRLDKLDDKVTDVRLLVDIDIEKKLNLLAEGQQVLLETMTPKTKTEELEEKYNFLQSIVAVLTKDVAELKKAQ